MLKVTLRKTYKALRKELSRQKIETLSIAIANNLIELPIWNYSFYHVFLSIEAQKEVNTDPLLSILSGMDKNIVIPKSNFKTGQMANYLLTDNVTIKKNAYDIPEPVDGIPIANDVIDVVFIPLLAFDTQGNRVGYGKGFYDRFLSQCRPDVLKIGLSFFAPEDHISDVYDTDIKLDYCISPTQVYSLK
jgi:5-formyltetrahydrofolate cyclo-ligase